MIIDIHTHIFPERVAEAVLANAEANLELPQRSSGTEKGLREEMESSGTDLSMVLAVATEARLVRKTNDWLLSIRDDRIQFFGTLLPDLDDWEGELLRLKREGVKGIKFNALLQRIRPDEERMFPIYERMVEEGFMVLFHAGPSYKGRNEPDKALAPPRSIARVLRAFPELTVIAAHWGGNHMLEEMREHLLGQDLYLDTSYPPDVYALRPEVVRDIVRAHGAHRILFGTDSPWETQARGIAFIRSLDLSEEEKEAILGGNAQQLIGL